jgi:hypothetical protein
VRAPLPGYLLAQRGADMTAVPFDERTLSVLALPVVVAPGVLPPEGAPPFATAPVGTLAYGRQSLHVVLDWTAELQRMVPRPPPSLPR